MIMNMHTKVSRAATLSIYSMVMNLGSVFSITGLVLFRQWNKRNSYDGK